MYADKHCDISDFLPIVFYNADRKAVSLKTPASPSGKAVGDAGVLGERGFYPLLLLRSYVRGKRQPYNHITDFSRAPDFIPSAHFDSKVSAVHWAVSVVL